ncbi:UNVERIFIED_CONTAM: hypothetical protein Sradi_5885800 [Sesamum radiatum]|uniref:Uncharacterized protein n=1 Tax=Sesamum radiatum TaxID=300843 RepID=A0AAW2KR56_SESRA
MGRGTTTRELRFQPPLVVTGIAAGSHLGRPRVTAHGRPVSARPHRAVGGGDAMRDAQADVAWPNGFGATCVERLDGSRILPFTPSIAFRYVLHRCESRDIRCRESF